MTGPVPETRVPLVALSAMEDYELAEYRAAFEAEHPGIEVSIRRLSTRHLHAHLLDHGDSDGWDVVLGWSVTSLIDAPILALLGRLDDSVLSVLPPSAVDDGGRWMSPSGFAPAFCVAARPIEERGLAIPTSWDDLAAPGLSGAVCVPDPNVSGAGFLHLTALVEQHGLAGAVRTLARVAANRPTIARSAFGPCEAVLDGDALVGVTVSTATRRLLREGHDVVSVLPSDAGRYELEAFAVNRRSPRHTEAMVLLRWMAGPAAAGISAAYGKVATTDPPARGTHPLVPVAATRAAGRRREMCEAWSGLFTARAESDKGEAAGP